MCIRDSTSDEQMRHGSEITNDRLAIHVLAKRDRQLGFAVNESFVLPVSYTHLRAHETVLDLVCRLLLEKKKKKNTKK